MTKKELDSLQITPPDEAVRKQVEHNWDKIAKPLNSMGKFETLIARIGAIIGNEEITLFPRAVLVFCGDNGIVEEGVSQSGQEVTAAVMASMIRGQSSVCKMAETALTKVRVIDIGVSCSNLVEAPEPSFFFRKIAAGTRNFLKEPAMTEEETLQAIETGIELVRECKREGFRLLAMGEMGIGNTTTSSAVAAALLRCPAEEITGKGAGISEEALLHKIEVIRQAMKQYDLYKADPFSILAAVGGLDIAGLVGMCIGGALYRIPIVLDGVISAAAALTAERMIPGIKEYLIPSHISREPAAGRLLEELGLTPVLTADMALGEGTGAVMMFTMMDAAMSVYSRRTEFDAIGVQQYKHL